MNDSSGKKYHIIVASLCKAHSYAKNGRETDIVMSIARDMADKIGAEDPEFNRRIFMNKIVTKSINL